MSATDRVYPIRLRVGRSDGKDRTVRSGFVWQDPSSVPGTILSPERDRILREELRVLDESRARARASAHTYWIYR